MTTAQGLAALLAPWFALVAQAADQPAPGNPQGEMSWNKLVSGEQTAPPESVLVLTVLDARVTGLSFEPTAEITGKSRGKGKVQSTVLVSGKFQRPGWRLVDGTNPTVEIPLDATGRFRLEILVTQKAQTFKLMALDPFGNREEDTRGIFYSIFDVLLAEARARASKASYFNVGLGATSNSYTQTYTDDYRGVAVTAKATFTWLVLPPAWDFAGNIFFNLLPLSSNLPDVKVRFLGANARFGFSMPFIPQPWRFSLLGGVFYSHMLVTNDAFGYSHMIYPQIYPVLRRGFNGVASGYVYFKYVPTGEGMSLSFSEREVAVGIGASFPTGNFMWTISLDYSDLVLKASERIFVKAKAFSLGFAVGI